MASNYVLEQTYEVPTTKAVTVEEVKSYGNINTDSKDSLLEELILAAQNAFTNYTSSVLYHSEVKCTLLVNNGGDILLPYPDVVSIDSLKDVDGKDVDYTLSGAWLQTAKQGTLKLTYRAGLFDPATNDVDPQIKLGIKKYVISNYDDTNDVAAMEVYPMPNSSKAQWQRYRYEFI